MSKINIAIDGPAGAGKSTVAKQVAEKLTYVYVDTGAMYRALTYLALQQNVDVHHEQQLVKLLQGTNIQLTPSTAGQKVWVNNTEITEEIRARDVTNNVSFVASHPLVRAGMVSMQQELAKQKGVVMDGRDIGTKVLPNAEVKFFLVASLEERARRRYDELQEKGQAISFEALKEEMALRDKRDSEREASPLIKAEDAIELDTTGLTIDEVVDSIIERVHTVIEKI